MACDERHETDLLSEQIDLEKEKISRVCDARPKGESHLPRVAQRAFSCKHGVAAKGHHLKQWGAKRELLVGRGRMRAG